MKCYTISVVQLLSIFRVNTDLNESYIVLEDKISGSYVTWC